MSSSQVQFVATSTGSILPQYSFLSHPPQKQIPTQPLPEPPAYTHTIAFPPETGPNRSATFANITAWIDNVQPGTPPPTTPRKYSSSSIHASSLHSTPLKGRRFSVTSLHVSSGPLLNRNKDSSAGQNTSHFTTAAAITPTSAGFEPDLKSIGYTSAFVNFQNIILPPPMPQQKKKRTAKAQLENDSTAASERPKRFRSLSLRSGRHARSNSTPQTIPPLPLLPVSAKSVSKGSTSKHSQDKSRSNKAHYVKARPPALATDLALAQMLDGGKLEDQIKRYSEAHARAAGAAKSANGHLVGVGDVWRDGQGGVWRDQEEEQEFTHLLEGDIPEPVEVEWVPFGPHPEEGKPPLGADWTRGSYSSQDSDLDPRYAMQPEDDMASLGNVLTPQALGIDPGFSLLEIPAQSRRAAKHFRKPEFLLDIFPVPPSDSSDTPSPRSPLTPRAVTLNVPIATGSFMRPTGKARRRPPPLTLTPPNPGHTLALNPSDPEDFRKDFLDSSFQPSVSHVVSPGPTRTPKTSIARLAALKVKTPMLNVKGFFKVVGRKIN